MISARLLFSLFPVICRIFQVKHNIRGDKLNFPIRDKRNVDVLVFFYKRESLKLRQTDLFSYLTVSPCSTLITNRIYCLSLQVTTRHYSLNKSSHQFPPHSRTREERTRPCEPDLFLFIKHCNERKSCNNTDFLHQWQNQSRPII